MRDDSLVRQAVDCFGWKYQLKKALQEYSEALTAGLKYLESLDSNSSRDKEIALNDFIGEIADTEVVNGCLREIFGHSAIAEAKLKAEKKLLGIIEARRGSQDLRQHA